MCCYRIVKEVIAEYNSQFVQYIYIKSRKIKIHIGQEQIDYIEYYSKFKEFGGKILFGSEASVQLRKHCYISPDTL